MCQRLNSSALLILERKIKTNGATRSQNGTRDIPSILPSTSLQFAVSILPFCSGELEDAKIELKTRVGEVDIMREEAVDLAQEAEDISQNIDTKQKRSNWIRKISMIKLLMAERKKKLNDNFQKKYFFNCFKLHERIKRYFF